MQKKDILEVKYTLLLYLHKIMDLNQIFEEQQNATKWKMASYLIRKDWLSNKKNAKWKLSETCTVVLEILNTPRNGLT